MIIIMPSLSFDFNVMSDLFLLCLGIAQWKTIMEEQRNN